MRLRPASPFPIALLALTAIVASALVVLFVTPLGAQRLPGIATPEHYDLEFVVDIPRQRFDGTETIRVQIHEPTTRVVLNAADLALREVSIHSQGVVQRAAVSLDPAAETATLTVARGVAAGPAEIRIRYGGSLNKQLRGFYVARGDKRNYAVTQLEATDARRLFPGFDEPAYKATFDITLTIADGDVAISNGRVVSDVPGPGPGQHTVKFSTSPKMSTYLVAIAVGDFACLEGSSGDTPIRVCAPAGKEHMGRIALELAQDILRFFNDYHTIEYPFGKLDMVAVPDFAAGAMENTAAIFYRETALLADTDTASLAVRKDIAAYIAHEVAHQWFGNLVTMRWWDDLWLNEGFATWMETRPLAASKPEWNLTVEEVLGNQAALSLDSLRSTRPIHKAVQTPAEIESLFDAISYQKGAAVLRMIEQYVGAARFREGINAYLEEHAYGNATSRDFWNAMTAATGRPIDRILPTFVDQPGAPLLEVSPLACTADGQTRATFSQERFLIEARAIPGADPAWRLPACIKASTSPDGALCQVIADQRVALDVAPRCASWIFANAGGLGYYRTAYGPDVLEALAPNMHDALSAPERLALMADEWALVRASRHTAADYLTLASSYGRESASGVLREVTDRLEFIHEYLTAGPARDRLEQFVRATLGPIADRLGSEPSPSDDDEARALRAVAIGALGTIGNDVEVVRRARAAVDRSLADGDGGALDPTLRENAVRIAAAHGDEKLYEALLAAAARATAPDERNLYLFATAEFREPSLIDRGLRRSISAEIRSQDAIRYLAAFFDNPVARPRAWAFVKSNWSALEPLLRVFNARARLTNALASFCDASTRDDIRAFLGSGRMQGIAGLLNQVIERINNCIELQEKQAASASEWLAARY